MNNLGLAHPKKIDIALPANLRCGRPADGRLPEACPDWAPLKFTFGGVWEIEPQALEEASASVQIVDVREPEEFTGPLGHIRGAALIPLGELSARLGEIDRERPVVAVCRAGGRSAQATVMLKRAGIEAAANLAGGMLRWRSQGYPVDGGASS